MSNAQATLTLPDEPAIPGLVFRFFQGEIDFPAIETVRKQVQAIDGAIWLPGPDTNPDDVCNPLHDCLIVEIDDQVIGYTWLTWWSESAVELFLHLGWLVPAWRRKGIGHALLRWQEQRLRQIAHEQPTTKPCVRWQCRQDPTREPSLALE